MRKQLVLGVALILATAMSMTAYAGNWETVGNDWKYKEDNGTYAANGWQWIDGKSYYFDTNGIMAKDTTIDGYTVNLDGQWTVNGVVQTQGTTGQAANTSGVNHSDGYDPAHPLKNVIDTWNLRLPTPLDGAFIEVVNNNVQAMLTGQMDQYFAAPVGEYVTATGNHVYTTQEDYDKARQEEQVLYQWFCNWLNGMDFEHMSEMERAQEIKKVLSQAKYIYGTNGGVYYGILIEGQGQCADFAMTSCALAKALGLKSGVTGYGDHAVYFVWVDGIRYRGSNEYLNLDTPYNYEDWR